MIKVLIVDLSLGYGGSNSRVISLIKKINDADVMLACLENSHLSQIAQKENVRCFTLGKNKLNPLILLKLIKLIKLYNIQVLDTQNIQSKFWGSLAASVTNIALVSTINSWYTNEHGKFSLKGKFYTFLELLTNWGLDLYITVSEKDKTSLINSNVDEKKIELVYNAIELSEGSVSGTSEWFREKYFIPKEAIICVAIGRLVHVKGYDVLIEAAFIAKEKSDKLVVVIVGEGEERSKLEFQIDALNLKETVILIGYQSHENVLSIIKSSDFFIMPSRYEGTPVALLEAAALGKPIIASNSGGIPELVKNEVHALLVPPENPKILAEAINKLYLNQNIANILGSAAKKMVQEKFSLKMQVSQTINAYQKAFDNHKKTKA